jgi:hypothetical protein
MNDLLQRACSGSFEVSGRTIELTRNPSSLGGQRRPYETGYSNRGGHSQAITPIALHEIGHTLVLNGDAQQLVFREVDDGLQALNDAIRTGDYPWDGVDGLTRDFLQSNQSIEYHTSAIFGLFAPIDVQLESREAALREGTLTFAVSARRAFTRHVRIGYFASESNGAVHTGSIMPLPSDWLAGRVECIWKGTVDLGAVDKAVLFLTMGKTVVSRHEVVDYAVSPNSVVQAYQYLDEDFSILLGQLAQPSYRGSGSHFERAVARVFVLAGFVTDAFAFEQALSQGPDALAHAPDATSLIVIECTCKATALAGKISQLLGRTKEIRSSLGEQFKGLVVPLLVTAQQVTDIAPSDLADATHNRVSVIGHNELKELIQMALRRASLREVTQFCLEHVPSTRSSDGSIA